MIKTLEGDVFIIPNALTSPANTIGEDKREKDADFADFVLKHVHNRYIGLADTRYVQVWVTSPECNSWVDRPCMGEKGEYFPGRLPVSIFKGKKEGDTVEILTKWGQVKLTLNQLQGRYRDKGTFEEVLESLIEFDEEYKREHYDNLPYIKGISK